MIQHELFLCIVQGAIGTFKHWNFMIDYMLVKVCVEEGLKSKHSIAHGTFIDHPERQTEKYLGMGAVQMLLLGLHHAYN